MADNTIQVIEAATGGTNLGAIDAMQGVTPVKIGKQTIVDQSGVEVPFAKDASVAAVTASLGTDGATPPTIVGTGVRGWLRAIYERLVAGVGRTWSLSAASDSVTVAGSVSVAGAVEVMNDAGNPLPVNGTVSVGNFPATQPVSGEVAANITKVNGAAHAAGNPLFSDVTDRAGRALGAVSGTVTANQGSAGAQAWPVSGPLTDTQLRASAVPVSGPLTNTELRATAVPVSLSGTGAAAGTPLFAQEVVGGSAVSLTNPVPTRNIPADLGVQAQSAAAAAVTLTIPAAGAGLFHYIDVIEIHVYATAARTGAAAPVTVTSTNLPGNLSWLFPTGQAIGTIDRYAFSGDRPMKSVAANTATTIVAPAVTGGIVQIKAVYSTGP